MSRILGRLPQALQDMAMVFISRALIRPVVSVRERPNGLPIAIPLYASCKLSGLPRGIGWVVERGRRSRMAAWS